MDAAQLTRFLHDHIPLAAAMEVNVTRADGLTIMLTAPLPPNTNHHGTVFGGSASALAILAAWTLVELRVQETGIKAGVVIQRNSINYERPITGSFSAVACAPDASSWSRFVTMLRRRGRARINVTTTLWCNDVHVGQLEGDFVATATGDARQAIIAE